MSYNQETSVRMIDRSGTPSIKLTCGMMFRTSYRQASGAKFLDIYVTDAEGLHVSAKTVRYTNDQEKAAKVGAAMNALKLEILAYEVNKLAQETGHNVTILRAHIAKRYAELGIKKVA